MYPLLIEVTVLETGGATFNKDTGKLVWKINLQPNETRKLTYKFEVKYPKDKQISGLWLVANYLESDRG